MKEKRYNQKRACALASIDPRLHRRVSKRPADTELRGRLKELSFERWRFGYRRLHILLKCEGWHMNWKKLYRFYREEGLTVRKRVGRKLAVGTRAPMAIPQGISNWIAFYNTERSHSALDRLTPDDAYWGSLEKAKTA